MREPKEIIINGKTLEKILENHKHWLNRDIAGWEYMYADLNSAILNYENLSGAHLRSADLRGADLDKEEQIRKGVKLSNSITGWKRCKDGVMCNDK